MLNYKFTQILKTLNLSEFKLLKKFISSPIYNTNPLIVKLYVNIKKYYPYFYSEKLTKASLFKKIYPGIVYNDKKMRVLSSEMLSLLEEFLVFLNNRKNPDKKEMIIAEELTERGVNKIAVAKLKLANTSIEKGKFIDLTSQINRLNNIKLLKLNKYYSHQSIKKNLDLTQKEINITTELIYLLSANLQTELYLQEPIQTNYSISPLFDSIYQQLKIYSGKSDNIRIIFLAVSLLKNNEHKTYNTLLKFYSDNLEYINNELKEQLRSSLIHYMMCNRNRFKGNLFYINMLNILGSPEEHLFGGHIRDQLFNNYVIYYLNSGMIKECLDFINYKNIYINPDSKRIVLNFNYSKYFLYTKNFKLALEHALKCKSKYWWYIINSYSTIIICYYELKDQKNLKKYLNLLIKYITKKKEITSDFQNNFNNFIQIVILLTKTNMDRSKINFAYRKLSKRGLVHSNWLYSKISAIKKAA